MSSAERRGNKPVGRSAHRCASSRALNRLLRNSWTTRAFGVVKLPAIDVLSWTDRLPASIQNDSGLPQGPAGVSGAS